MRRVRAGTMQLDWKKLKYDERKGDVLANAHLRSYPASTERDIMGIEISKDGEFTPVIVVHALLVLRKWAVQDSKKALSM